MARADRDDNNVTGLLGTSTANDQVTVSIFANPTTRRLLVDALTALVGNATMVDGRKVTTTAGTAVALGSTTTIKRIHIQALPDNTDIVAIGGSTVVAAAATAQGISLGPFQSITLTNDDLADIFVDSRQDSEGVSFIYEV